MSEIKERATTITDEQRRAVAEAVAQALGDAYYCTRDWAAWEYGTMWSDDFAPIAENDDRVAEIADAAIKALSGQADAKCALSDGEGRIRERAKIAAKEMIRTGWGRWSDAVTDLLAELERVEGNRESECMECEKLACTEIRQQAVREVVEIIDKYPAFLFGADAVGVKLNLSQSIKARFGLDG